MQYLYWRLLKLYHTVICHPIPYSSERVLNIHRQPNDQEETLQASDKGKIQSNEKIDHLSFWVAHYCNWVFVSLVHGSD